jgi:transcriptional regulator with PAS, ATPase and Fis domain
VATGVSRRDGKFQLADAGMLFFDEVADMAPGLQAKLLRALQEGEVHPVGARQPVRVDVRIVAATNTDLEERMRAGAFRRDLFFRLAGCEIHVPPLRERREDIPGLVQQFLSTFAEEANRSILGVTLRALEILQAAAWPGNVRELEHEMRRLVSLCPEGGTIESTMISSRVRKGCGAERRVGPSFGLKDRVADLERRLIADAVDCSEGNLAEAARLLGITRNGLVMKMQRLGIERG